MEKHGIQARGAYGQAQEIQDNSSRVSLEQRAEPTPNYNQLDILDLIRQGHSPPEAAEMASKDIYERLGLDYKVEVEKQAKKASLEDEVSNLEVAGAIGKKVVRFGEVAIKSLYMLPTVCRKDLKVTMGSEDIIVSTFWGMLGGCVASNIPGIIYFNVTDEHNPGLVLFGLLPVATTLASGIYEYFRYTKNWMSEEKKKVRKLESELV